MIEKACDKARTHEPWKKLYLFTVSGSRLSSEYQREEKEEYVVTSCTYALHLYSSSCSGITWNLMGIICKEATWSNSSFWSVGMRIFKCKKMLKSCNCISILSHWIETPKSVRVQIKPWGIVGLIFLWYLVIWLKIDVADCIFCKETNFPTGTKFPFSAHATAVSANSCTCTLVYLPIVHMLCV